MSDRSSGLGLLLAAAVLVFGYVWGSNARMDVVWNEGYEAGLRGGAAVRRIVPCPICGFVALVVTTIRGLFGGHRHLSWSRVLCLRGHRSLTTGKEAT